MTASGYKVTVHKLIVQIVLIRSVFQILYTVAVMNNCQYFNRHAACLYNYC